MLLSNPSEIIDAQYDDDFVRDLMVEIVLNFYDFYQLMISNLNETTESKESNEKTFTESGKVYTVL